MDVSNGASPVKNSDHMKEVLHNMLKSFASGSNCIFGENVLVTCEEHELHVIHKSPSYSPPEVSVP